MIIVRMRTFNFNKEHMQNNGYYPHLINPAILPELKFTNDHKFDFEITNPKNWYIFLSNYKLKTTGEKLPRVTKEGKPIVYDVYVWGWCKALTNPKGGHNNISLFPGYDKEGNRLHPGKYGVLK